MGSVNLQGLIDEVLQMVKERQNPNSEFNKNQEYNRRDMFRMKTDAERDARTATLTNEIERQKLLNSGAMNVQGLKNTGDLATQGLVNTGALARQRLSGESAIDVARLGLEGEKFKAEKNVEAWQGRANDISKPLSAWITANPLATPGQILEMRKKLQASIVEPSQDSVSKFEIASSNKSNPIVNLSTSPTSLTINPNKKKPDMPVTMSPADTLPPSFFNRFGRGFRQFLNIEKSMEPSISSKIAVTGPQSAHRTWMEDSIAAAPGAVVKAGRDFGQGYSGEVEAEKRRRLGF